VEGGTKEYGETEKKIQPYTRKPIAVIDKKEKSEEKCFLLIATC
jgi:hypothetical protein